MEEKAAQEVPSSNPQVDKPDIEKPSANSKKISLFWILTISILLMLVLVAGYFFMTSSKKQKIYHVGVLSGLSFFADTTDGFKTKMTELGYIEGKNIVYDVQKTEVDIASYQRILKKFVADKDDLIFSFPTEASLEAKSATIGTNIPVVFANAFTDDTGLVESIRKPGKNVTGVRWAGPDLALQRFEIMSELMPNLKRILVPYLKGYPIVKSQLEALRPVVKSNNITIIEIPAGNAAELSDEFQKVDKSISSADAILLISEPLCVTPDAFVVMAEFAEKHKIIYGGAYMTIGTHESFFGVTPQSIPQGKQAAVLADKIIKGTSPSVIPVVSAEPYFQLSNRAIKKAGLIASEILLSKANEIIR
jgi:putative tryptophan/tyrosine transport system substrate-binding protein